MRERAEEQYNPMVVVQNYKRIAQVWLDEPRRREFYKEYEIPYENIMKKFFYAMLCLVAVGVFGACNDEEEAEV